MSDVSRRRFFTCGPTRVDDWGGFFRALFSLLMVRNRVYSLGACTRDAIRDDPLLLRRDNLLERALQGLIVSIRADFLGGFDEPLRLLGIVRLGRFARD
jgi:hypothetical protein